MMRWMLTLMVLAAVVGGMGCESGQQNTEAMRVPPPAYDTSEPEPMPATVDHGSAVPADTVAQPAPLPEPIQEPSQAGGPGTYTVKKGDTLWSIAHSIYGDGQKWVDIVRANPGLKAEKMAVGQQITLP